MQPKNNIYASFGVFCPSERIECVDLLDSEDILIDWKESMYLNFTHLAIMNRLDAFYKIKYGVMERLAGDIYVNTGLPEELELERYYRKFKTKISLKTYTFLVSHQKKWK